MPKWDRDVSYEYALTKIMEYIQKLKLEIRYSYRKIRRLRHLYYCYVLLLCLTNGARVSEAIEGLNKFIINGKREQEVKVRQCRTLETRLIIIPKIISDLDRYILQQFMDTTRSGVTIFATRELGFNPHSLRYSFISRLIRKGINPIVIAEIVKLKTLNIILNKMQEIQANNILRDIIQHDTILNVNLRQW